MRTTSVLRVSLFLSLLLSPFSLANTATPPRKPDPRLFAVYPPPSAVVPTRWAVMGVEFDKQVFVVRSLVTGNHPIYGFRIIPRKSSFELAINAEITERNGGQYTRKIWSITRNEFKWKTDNEVLASITDCIKQAYQYGSMLEKDRKLISPEQVVTDATPWELQIADSFNKELFAEFPEVRPHWNIGFIKNRGGKYLLVTAPVWHLAGVDHVLMARIAVKDLRTEDGRFVAAVKTAIRLSRYTKTPHPRGVFIAATAALQPNRH